MKPAIFSLDLFLVIVQDPRRLLEFPSLSHDATHVSCYVFLLVYLSHRNA